MPPYLRVDHFETLRNTVGRIEIITGELGDVLRRMPSNSVDRFNFSNVFEWVPQQVFEEILRETHRVARPAARLCYRNLLVRRRHSASLDHMLTPREELAAGLLWRDRSFVYSHFEVAEVKKEPMESEQQQLQTQHEAVAR